jgi:hypothetical protein
VKGEPTNVLLDKDLIRSGFSVPMASKIKRIVMCTKALDKRGKTHFAMTAPGPIAIVGLDTGTKEVASKFLGTKELICAYHKVTGKLADVKKTAEAADKEWDTVRDSIETATNHPKIRTLIIDTGTEVWELLRLARFGKLAQVMPHQYGPVNKEMRDLVKRAYEREDLNVIWIHKLKKQYSQNKKGEDSWNGSYDLAGYSDIPYLVDLTLEHYWVSPTEDEPGRFGIHVTGVGRQTPDVCGLKLEGDDCNFQMLAMMLYPDVDPAWWV